MGCGRRPSSSSGVGNAPCVRWSRSGSHPVSRRLAARRDLRLFTWIHRSDTGVVLLGRTVRRSRFACSRACASSRLPSGPREVSVARRSGAWPGAGAEAAGCGPRRRTDGWSDERARSLRACAVLAAAESKSSRHGEALGQAVTRGLARVGPCPCGSLPPAVCGHAHMRRVYTAPRV